MINLLESARFKMRDPGLLLTEGDKQPSKMLGDRAAKKRKVCRRALKRAAPSVLKVDQVP